MCMYALMHTLLLKRFLAYAVTGLQTDRLWIVSRGYNGLSECVPVLPVCAVEEDKA